MLFFFLGEQKTVVNYGKKKKKNDKREDRDGKQTQLCITFYGYCRQICFHR